MSMEQQEPAQLSNEELLQEAKKGKSTKIMDAVIIGFLVGIAAYSVYNKGFGLLTFLPLLYLPIAARNRSKREAVKKLLQERNLN
jgi:hypothetical protein